MIKSVKIKAKIQETKKRRQSLNCKVYSLKIDKSSLSKTTKKQLKSLFLESKWLYNHILSTTNIKDFDTKISSVPVLVKDQFENRKLNNISSQMKQSIKDRLFTNILSLAKLKEKNYKIGKLKYKSKLYSIPLKQYNNTYKLFFKEDKIKIQGIRQKLRVRGFSQIPINVEFANSTLIQKANDYYLNITTYQTKEYKVIPEQSIGIDFGCQTQLTLSNGIKINYQIPNSKRLKRLDRKIMKKNRKHSNNKYKDQIKREKEYLKLTNKRKDIKNKIVNILTNNYKYICLQNENVRDWKVDHGKKIQYSAIGGIIRDLKNKSHTPIVVDQFFPSTQLCPVCGNKEKLERSDRTYICSICNYTEDRDIKSAVCIETEGMKNYLPMERREVKPVETDTSVEYIRNSFRRIPNVSVSLCRDSHINLRKIQEAPEFIRG